MPYLLDTNVIINYLDASLPASAMQFLHTVVDETPIISIITKMEALGYNFHSADEQNVMETLVNASTILTISNDVVNRTIDIKRTKKIKLPDAIIAASALVYNLIIISCNTADFKNIEGLEVIDPYKL